MSLSTGVFRAAQERGMPENLSIIFNKNEIAALHIISAIQLTILRLESGITSTHVTTLAHLTPTDLPIHCIASVSSGQMSWPEGWALPFAADSRSESCKHSHIKENRG